MSRATNLGSIAALFTIFYHNFQVVFKYAVGDRTIIRERRLRLRPLRLVLAYCEFAFFFTRLRV